MKKICFTVHQFMVVELASIFEKAAANTRFYSKAVKTTIRLLKNRAILCVSVNFWTIKVTHMG